MFVYRKITKFEYTYKITVLVMTDIVLVHDQKHFRGHYFLVRPNASPKSTPVSKAQNKNNFPYVKSLYHQPVSSLLPVYHDGKCS